jgi:hypothetical protein
MNGSIQGAVISDEAAIHSRGNHCEILAVPEQFKHRSLIIAKCPRPHFVCKDSITGVSPKRPITSSAQNYRTVGQNP